jgi:tRNA threonylcarbamoyladenosine biosynthesis protein TsaE
MSERAADLEHVFESRSPVETWRLGARLGRALAAGDVVALRGPLGAGKTAFAQGVARGLGVPARTRVASPTFTIVNEHAGRVPLYHIDLYRIGDPGELEEIGLREYLSGAGVAVVEWFERAPEAQPAELLEIEFEPGFENQRRLHARAFGATAAARLRAWIG